MMFITNAAVSLFFSSLFLMPAAWKSFFHSGGMLRISKPLSEFQPIDDTCRKLSGSEITSDADASSLALNIVDRPLKRPFFFFAGACEVFNDADDNDAADGVAESAGGGGVNDGTEGGGGGGGGVPDTPEAIDCGREPIGGGGGGARPETLAREGSVRAQN
jgi:hypothetical protein